MRAKFMKEVAAAGLPPGPGPDSPVTEADLAGLPHSVRRYLGFMGVVGKPSVWSFRLAFTGRFRRSRHDAWMACEAWQYNSRLAVARIFHIRLRGLVPVLARDTYVRGRGRMLIRLFDLVTVGDGAGVEFDTGELVTYLNDGVMIAPSILLVPEVRWSPVDERGAPTDFSTTDRFAADPKDASKLVRTRWTTPIDGWQEVGGRRLWTRGRAVWHMPEGEFAYADFTPVPGSLALNVRPGE
jgi:hypothetical protein